MWRAGGGGRGGGGRGGRGRRNWEGVGGGWGEGAGVAGRRSNEKAETGELLGGLTGHLMSSTRAECDAE